MNGSAVFSYIFTEIETPLLASLAQVVSALISYAAGPIQTALVIYIALTGVLMLRGHASETMGGLIGRLVKMTIVAWFATNGALYSEWVSNFFLTALPNDVTHAVATALHSQAAIFCKLL